MSTIKTNQLAHTANGAAVYTLPTTDGSAGQVLQTNGSGVLSWVTLPSSGLTMADQWRITNSLNGVSSSTYITANWERVDTDGFWTAWNRNDRIKRRIYISFNGNLPYRY